MTLSLSLMPKEYEKIFSQTKYELNLCDLVLTKPLLMTLSLS
jgi:hypothetical protein